MQWGAWAAVVGCSCVMQVRAHAQCPRPPRVWPDEEALQVALEGEVGGLRSGMQLREHEVRITRCVTSRCSLASATEDRVTSLAGT